jgi:hypothetical protein
MASLIGLVPELRPAAEWLYGYGHSLDPSLRVTSGLRTFLEQSRLYQRYRQGKSRFPAAPPGQSKHEFGLAFDMARMNTDPRADELLNYLGDVWLQIGGFWHPSDPVHFEV